jgi:hypothetical protein
MKRFIKALALCVLAAQPLGATAQPAQPLLVSKIEAATGCALTPAQRRAILAKSREAAAELRAAQEDFVTSIAAAVALPAETVRGYLPTVGADNTGFDKNMIPKVEAQKGRALTREERTAIRAADDAKKARMAPVQQSLARTLSEQTGMTLEQAAALLPKVGL